ncbi:hypothetical protein CARUB_v10013643mg [Capsella rubella]|uniref:Uncharacterized protein n=1 Tax=Capsella rubella TaxID=81985 RepID=R0HYB1_9BRAS|nr:uncharacterized protein LOC17893849 [Capsella rubella]XP_006297623.1 uncharacterized protein LOC17893849 [Capsella rubella]EOA30520.1 hypothetical protein CARUB_v10013643mg [Capsella rubella]EOA30521.1 hypothetical protein CARUB_v10013643mg [Capsella rubella]
MDSIEPPSFSLGFDLDAASDPQSDSHQNPSPSGDQLIGDEPEPGLTVPDSDQELDPAYVSPVLKRLRRGINPNKCPAKDDRGVASDLLGCREDRDDDIEEFSSPEDSSHTDAPASTRSHFSSCSSRVPLHGTGVLSNQPSISRGKRKQSDVPASAGSGISSIASLFQRSARSPLRRFQLLDSDSEDDHPSTSRDLSGVTKATNSSSKDNLSVASKSKRKEPGSIPCIKDLWKDFSPAISKIQTPALDDVCQDYFSSIKTTSTAQKQSSAVASSSNSGYHNLTGFQQTGQFLDLSHPSPPSHRFFLHSDPRIRNLARQRLPNFLPLGIVNDRESQREVFLVDYMNQFGSKGSSKTEASSSKSCRRGQAKSKVSKGQESTHTSEGWLNPKTRSAAPKDAGKRRVSANSGSAGHWFTSAEGRKVYISKSGQEFSGQSAYRCYKKETGGGGGFKKSKKKRQPKKKARS